MIEEVEQHRLGPLKVIDMQHQGALGGERLEQPPYLPEELLRDRRAAARETLDDGVRQLARRPQRVDQRPERDALAVWQAAAAQHGRLSSDRCQQLGDEARLADTRRAEQREQMTARLPDSSLPGL